MIKINDLANHLKISVKRVKELHYFECNLVSIEELKKFEEKMMQKKTTQSLIKAIQIGNIIKKFENKVA